MAAIVESPSRRPFASLNASPVSTPTRTLTTGICVKSEPIESTSLVQSQIEQLTHLTSDLGNFGVPLCDLDGNCDWRSFVKLVSSKVTAGYNESGNGGQKPKCAGTSNILIVTYRNLIDCWAMLERIDFSDLESPYAEQIEYFAPSADTDELAPCLLEFCSIMEGKLSSADRLICTKILASIVKIWMMFVFEILRDNGLAAKLESSYHLSDGKFEMYFSGMLSKEKAMLRADFDVASNKAPPTGPFRSLLDLESQVYAEFFHRLLQTLKNGRWTPSPSFWSDLEFSLQDLSRNPAEKLRRKLSKVEESLLEKSRLPGPRLARLAKAVPLAFTEAREKMAELLQLTLPTLVPEDNCGKLTQFLVSFFAANETTTDLYPSLTVSLCHACAPFCPGLAEKFPSPVSAEEFCCISQTIENIVARLEYIFEGDGNEKFPPTFRGNGIEPVSVQTFASLVANAVAHLLLLVDFSKRDHFRKIAESLSKVFREDRPEGVYVNLGEKMDVEIAWVKGIMGAGRRAVERIRHMPRVKREESAQKSFLKPCIQFFGGNDGILESIVGSCGGNLCPDFKTYQLRFLGIKTAVGVWTGLCFSCASSKHCDLSELSVVLRKLTGLLEDLESLSGEIEQRKSRFFGSVGSAKMNDSQIRMKETGEKLRDLIGYFVRSMPALRSVAGFSAFQEAKKEAATVLISHLLPLYGKHSAEAMPFCMFFATDFISEKSLELKVLVFSWCDLVASVRRTTRTDVASCAKIVWILADMVCALGFQSVKYREEMCVLCGDDPDVRSLSKETRSILQLKSDDKEFVKVAELLRRIAIALLEVEIRKCAELMLLTRVSGEGLFIWPGRFKQVAVALRSRPAQLTEDAVRAAGTLTQFVEVIREIGRRRCNEWPSRFLIWKAIGYLLNSYNPGPGFLEMMLGVPVVDEFEYHPDFGNSWCGYEPWGFGTPPVQDIMVDNWNQYTAPFVCQFGNLPMQGAQEVASQQSAFEANEASTMKTQGGMDCEIPVPVDAASIASGSWEKMKREAENHTPDKWEDRSDDHTMVSPPMNLQSWKDKEPSSREAAVSSESVFAASHSPGSSSRISLRPFKKEAAKTQKRAKLDVERKLVQKFLASEAYSSESGMSSSAPERSTRSRDVKSSKFPEPSLTKSSKDHRRRRRHSERKKKQSPVASSKRSRSRERHRRRNGRDVKERLSYRNEPTRSRANRSRSRSARGFRTQQRERRRPGGEVKAGSRDRHHHTLSNTRSRRRRDSRRIHGDRSSHGDRSPRPRDGSVREVEVQNSADDPDHCENCSLCGERQAEAEELVRIGIDCDGNSRCEMSNTVPKTFPSEVSCRDWSFRARSGSRDRIAEFNDRRDRADLGLLYPISPSPGPKLANESIDLNRRSGPLLIPKPVPPPVRALLPTPSWIGEEHMDIEHEASVEYPEFKHKKKPSLLNFPQDDFANSRRGEKYHSQVRSGPVLPEEMLEVSMDIDEDDNSALRTDSRPVSRERKGKSLVSDKMSENSVAPAQARNGNERGSIFRRNRSGHYKEQPCPMPVAESQNVKRQFVEITEPISSILNRDTSRVHDRKKGTVWSRLGERSEPRSALPNRPMSKELRKQPVSDFTQSLQRYNNDSVVDARPLTSHSKTLGSDFTVKQRISLKDYRHSASDIPHRSNPENSAVLADGVYEDELRQQNSNISHHSGSDYMSYFGGCSADSRARQEILSHCRDADTKAQSAWRSVTSSNRGGVNKHSEQQHKQLDQGSQKQPSGSHRSHIAPNFASSGQLHFDDRKPRQPSSLDAGCSLKCEESESAFSRCQRPCFQPEPTHGVDTPFSPTKSPPRLTIALPEPVKCEDAAYADPTGQRSGVEHSGTESSRSESDSPGPATSRVRLSVADGPAVSEDLKSEFSKQRRLQSDALSRLQSADVEEGEILEDLETAVEDLIEECSTVHPDSGYLGQMKSDRLELQFPKFERTKPRTPRSRRQNADFDAAANREKAKLKGMTTKEVYESSAKAKMLGKRSEVEQRQDRTDEKRDIGDVTGGYRGVWISDILRRN